MHKFLRSIGFSEYNRTGQIQDLVRHTIMNAEKREYATAPDKEDVVLVQFSKDFSENTGIAVCGEFDAKDNFIYYYSYPYLRGTQVSSMEEITIERHAATESYAGVCDDIKVGVTLIFYLNNMIPYLKIKNAGKLPMQGTSLILSALAVQASVMMPISKSERQKRRSHQTMVNRNQLIEAARKGDEDAIESLTLEDMDTYSNISKKIQKEDIFSLVDTYFMPYGVECDQYSILGEILECRKTENELTHEKLWMMRVECNELQFDVCMNEMDLFGEPAVGRRLKAIIWLQGIVNYPEMN